MPDCSCGAVPKVRWWQKAPKIDYKGKHITAFSHDASCIRGNLFTHKENMIFHPDIMIQPSSVQPFKLDRDHIRHPYQPCKTFAKKYNDKALIYYSRRDYNGTNSIDWIQGHHMMRIALQDHKEPNKPLLFYRYTERISSQPRMGPEHTDCYSNITFAVVDNHLYCYEKVDWENGSNDATDIKSITKAHHQLKGQLCRHDSLHNFENIMKLLFQSRYMQHHQAAVYSRTCRHCGSRMKMGLDWQGEHKLTMHRLVNMGTLMDIRHRQWRRIVSPARKDLRPKNLATLNLDSHMFDRIIEVVERNRPAKDEFYETNYGLEVPRNRFFPTKMVTASDDWETKS
jgi:hypothetical protein